MFNEVSLGGPNAALGEPLPACNPGFGGIAATQSASRQIQLALEVLVIGLMPAILSTSQRQCDVPRRC